MRLYVLTTALVCALALGACGSSGQPSTTASAKAGVGLQFAQCMRSHGVTNFPDPTAQGQIAVTPSEVQSPAFQSAQQACRHLLPNKGTPPRMTASERAAALRFAECMRTHGEPNFPDPSEGTPASNGAALVLRGMSFAVGPGLDPRSPALRQAAQRCGIRLPKGPARAIG